MGGGKKKTRALETKEKVGGESGVQKPGGKGRLRGSERKKERYPLFAEEITGKGGEKYRRGKMSSHAVL